MDEGTLSVHQIELVIDTREGFGDGSCIGNHAYSSLDAGKISSRNDSRRLVVDTTLETSWAPIDELNGSLSLDGGDSRVDILRDDITAEHKATSHELSVTRIALGKHVGWLEHRVGDLGDGQLLVVCLLSRDDRGIGGKHKVNTRVWHKVCLELSNIDVEGTVEAERGSKGRDHLCDDSVEVGVCRSLDIEVTAAYVIKSFVIDTESAVSVLQERVGREHVIVRLDDGSRHLRSRSYGERKL